MPPRYRKKWSDYIGCEVYDISHGDIICKHGEKAGKVMFRINTVEGGLSPSEKDALEHYIVEKLNKDRDFGDFYNKYMEE